MGTLTPARDSILSSGIGPGEFLPRESPMEMSIQPLRQFRKDDIALRSRGLASADARVSSSIGLRRACIFAGTAVMTFAGCYEMYEVLQVGGITVLESIVLGLFILLVAWVAFSFMSSLAGFCLLLFRRPDGLGRHPNYLRKSRLPSAQPAEQKYIERI
jgi:membrane glycosyltransferase